MDGQRVSLKHNAIANSGYTTIFGIYCVEFFIHWTRQVTFVTTGKCEVPVAHSE